MNREAALALAEEKKLDLIEIAPAAQPPVARIMSFDKFRYLQGKKVRKEWSGFKAHAPKQIQISARAAHHDMEIKANQARKFLAQRHPVNVVLVLRGREKGHRDWAQQRLNEFLKMIGPYKMVSPPKFFMRGINIQISHAQIN